MINLEIKGSVWSKVVGFYLLANGIFGLFVTGYYRYIDPTYFSQSPIVISILNNILFPVASALVGCYLLIFPSIIRWTVYFLLASIFGLGYGEYIYWSGHGYVIQTYMYYNGLFFAINFTSIIGLWFMYKHKGQRL